MMMREGNRKETCRVASLVVVALVVLSSCGSTPPDEEAADQQETPTTTVAEAEPAEEETDEASADSTSTTTPDQPDSATEVDDASAAADTEDASTVDELGDAWMLDSPSPGELIVGDDVIGSEGETVLSVGPEGTQVFATTTFGEATVEIAHQLPHYDIVGVEVTMPDGAVVDLGEPSIDQPSTAVTVQAQILSGPMEGQWASFAVTFLAGSTSVEVEGTQATVSGRIGRHTQAQIDYLASEHPEVDTLVLADISGAVEDEIEQTFGRVDPWFTADAAAQRVREHGFTTVVPVDGTVSDRGLLLFAGGTERIIETEGGHTAPLEYGNLSVQGLVDGEGTAELDQYSAVHAPAVQAWSGYLGETSGTGLVMYLARASVDGPHRLTPAEIDLFELTTTPLTLSQSFGPDAIDADHYLVGPAIDQTVNRPADLIDIIVEEFNAGQVGLEDDAQVATALVAFDSDQTLAYVLVEGGGDDSVRGEVATIVFEGDDEFGWVVTEVHHRWICARQLSDGVCL